LVKNSTRKNINDRRGFKKPRRSSAGLDLLGTAASAYLSRQAFKPFDIKLKFFYPCYNPTTLLGLFELVAFILNSQSNHPTFNREA
jgi:hypothetical protein